MNSREFYKILVPYGKIPVGCWTLISSITRQPIKIGCECRCGVDLAIAIPYENLDYDMATSVLEFLKGFGQLKKNPEPVKDKFANGMIYHYPYMEYDIFHMVRVSPVLVKEGVEGISFALFTETESYQELPFYKLRRFGVISRSKIGSKLWEKSRSILRN